MVWHLGNLSQRERESDAGKYTVFSDAKLDCRAVRYAQKKQKICLGGLASLDSSPEFSP